MRFSNIPRSYLTSMNRRSSGLQSIRSGSTSSLMRSLKSGGVFKFKSASLISGSLSASNKMSISRSSIKSAVSQAIRSDVSDVSTTSDKVSKGLTKEYVAALKSQAQEDAQAGTYGKDGKASELRADQMKKYVSPDRDSAIAQASKLLPNSSARSMGTRTMRLSGLPYTVSVSQKLSGTTAEIYDESGERFASYDSKSGQWKSVATKAESQFQTASSSIYDEAYRAAATGKNSSINKNTSSGLDVRV